MSCYDPQRAHIKGANPETGYLQPSQEARRGCKPSLAAPPELSKKENQREENSSNSAGDGGKGVSHPKLAREGFLLPGPVSVPQRRAGGKTPTEGRPSFLHEAMPTAPLSTWPAHAVGVLHEQRLPEAGMQRGWDEGPRLRWREQGREPPQSL